MSDYEPLDLARLYNAGLNLLPSWPATPIGRQQFRGIPFEIGSDADRCFIGFGDGVRADPLTIPIDRPARSVVMAHRLVKMRLLEGIPVGETVAECIFRYQDGGEVRLPIRDRFEIGAPRTSLQDGSWGQLPFRALPEKPGLPPRYHGAFNSTGARQTEAVEATPVYFLWAWINPRPDVRLAGLTIVPMGPRFVLGGVTLGQVDEHPLAHPAARPVKISLVEHGPHSSRTGPGAGFAHSLASVDHTIPGNPAWRCEVAVEVDRGVATFPYPLPEQPPEAYLGDAFAGWGEAVDDESHSVYVAIAAIPSATVTVMQAGEELGRAQWTDIEAAQVVEAGRVRIEVVDPGRNWVRTTVLDDETGSPVPCRVHFRSPEGIPYQPHGHHDHVNGNLGTWHADVGGDLRLGQTTYAYVDGRCEGWLPRGEVLVDVARGFEYEPLRARVSIAPGQQELTLRLKRWCDMNARGWYSGDTHVHFLSAQGSHAEARGEDLNVVNLLLSQWGHLFTNSEEFTGRPSVSPDGRTIVYATQENRQHLLGHLSLLGLKEPVMPWCTDGPSEAEMGGALEATLSDWADRCHAQGGTVVLPHLPGPNGEPAALIATGRVDAVEMLVHAMYYHHEYYRYLNSGYRLPLVGGTDKMSSEVPVGLYRTYVHIPADQGFTYEAWCKSLAAGRTFLSSGPIISLTVDGHAIGDTVRLPGNGGMVEVEAWAESIFPIHALEIVQQGRVVAATGSARGTRRLQLKERIRVDGHTWLAARAGGPGYAAPLPHHDVWARGVMAHTSPIYIACGGEWWLFDPDTAQYMLTLIEGNLSYIRELSPQHRPGTVTHHHGEADHQAYLERPFLQAREAIHRRMHDLGIPH